MFKVQKNKKQKKNNKQTKKQTNKKNTESIDPKVSATNNGRTMILSKCALCGSKKSKFAKKQEAKGLLSSLGIKTPYSNIPLPMWRDVF